MTGLEILIAIAGVAVMCLVVAGMILITPLGEEPVHTDAADANGSNLSPVDDRTARAAAGRPR